jgi:uridine kinase
MRHSELGASLAARIRAVRREHPVRVAIDGVDAAGKTTLADDLARELERCGCSVIRASIDGFHNPAAVRHRRAASGEGYFRDSFDYEALSRALLTPLGPSGSRRYCRAVFDHRTDSPVQAPTEEARKDAILLLDGVFLLRSELRAHWDFSIFVAADFRVTVARAEVRDRGLFGNPTDVRRRYESRYVPGQRLYLESERPRSHASVVVLNDDPEDPALEDGVEPDAAADPAGPGSSGTW